MALPILHWHSAGKIAFGPTKILCETHIAEMSQQQGSLWLSCLLPVSYTAPTMLLCSSVKCKAFCTCPLVMVQSVGKNLIFAYRVSLQNLLCLNVTNTREFVAELTTASKLHSTEYAAVFISDAESSTRHFSHVLLRWYSR